MILTPETPVVRDAKALRERVDAKLGQGSGMSMEEARNRLSPAERAEWVLGECLASMSGRRFHIWVQGWCGDRGIDGPAALAAIAEAARPLDGHIADLLRWTALRGDWARSGERKEALFDVVPEVWHGAWDRVVPFMKALVSRWPEEADPFALPSPPPWARPSGTGTKPRLEFKTAGEVREKTAYALWAAGASEDDLDAFFWDSGDDLEQAVTSRVDCDTEHLNALLDPEDPLATALGLEEIRCPSLVMVDPARETEILKAAEFWNRVVLPMGNSTFAESVRAAVRMDPDLIVGWTRDMGPDDAALVLTMLQTGQAVLLFGTRDALRDIPEEYFAR